jgi:hypothetical protein
MKLIKNLSLLVIIGSLLINCNNSKPSNTKNSRDQGTDTRKNYCYRNEYPFADNPEDKDIIELIIEITGNKVKGTYHWIPAFKDQRKGCIEGTIINNYIVGNYIYIQEGIRDTVNITITLNDEEAIIDGDPPELGLAATVAKIACNN